MRKAIITWDKDATKDPEIEYQTLLKSLNAKHGFDFVFVRCSPVEAEQIVSRSQRDIEHKNVQVLRLHQPTEDLYTAIANLTSHKHPDLLFVTGIEEFLVGYTQQPNLDVKMRQELDSVPKPLAKLCLLQKKLQQEFDFCFVFLLPLFALKYFVGRLPTFFDESVQVYEFPTDMELRRQEVLRRSLEDRYQNYLIMTPEERDRKFQELQKLIDAQPNKSDRRVELLLEQGGLLAAGRSFAEAIANCDLALEITPSSHLAWYNRGVALDLLGKHQEAITSYNQALSHKDNFHPAHYNLGTSLSMLGCFEEAIAAFNRALNLKPDYHPAFASKGALLNDLGQYEEAISNCDKALAIQPNYIQGWFSRGYALESMGRYVEAIKSYDRALEFKPGDHQLWYWRAKALDSLGEYSEAIASYDRALVIRPDDYYAWNNRGLALSNLDLYEEAIASFDKALEIKPDDHYAWYCRGNAHSALGRLEEAIACYDKAIQIEPEEPEVWQNRRVAFRRLGFN
ncbi:tetratricopeptide repeat protein [Tumidithrix elongata RA019]|uniref:Tetratricopeptide repeat protein n=1 Tax=Tumidithrix elongata BACA0141 TaxID=2716417 RepID=A0AAW9Q598_9CYAN|nr:tetratricopeptide repeat protein [Tumidithrix elongata RA019]